MNPCRELCNACLQQQLEDLQRCNFNNSFAIELGQNPRCCIEDLADASFHRRHREPRITKEAHHDTRSKGTHFHNTDGNIEELCGKKTTSFGARDTRKVREHRKIPLKVRNVRILVCVAQRNNFRKYLIAERTIKTVDEDN